MKRFLFHVLKLSSGSQGREMRKEARLDCAACFSTPQLGRVPLRQEIARGGIPRFHERITAKSPVPRVHPPKNPVTPKARVTPIFIHVSVTRGVETFVFRGHLISPPGFSLKPCLPARHCVSWLSPRLIRISKHVRLKPHQPRRQLLAPCREQCAPSLRPPPAASAS